MRLLQDLKDFLLVPGKKTLIRYFCGSKKDGKEHFHSKPERLSYAMYEYAIFTPSTAGRETRKKNEKLDSIFIWRIIFHHLL